jgi:hypothetical protein
MRKRYVWITLVFCFSCTGNRNANALSGINDLPSFNILLTDSTTVFSTNKIPFGKPTVFIFFEPDCLHCQHQTKILLKNIKSFENIQICMVTLSPFDQIREFCNVYRLNTYKNISVGKDYQYTFIKIFKPEVVPFIAIYDGNKKLVKIFKQPTEINNILEAVKI